MGGLGFLGAALSGFGGGSIGAAVVHLLLDSKGFTTGLAKSEAQLKGSTSKMGSALSGLGPTFALVGAAAVAGIGVAAVKAFEESDAAIQQTNAVLKSTEGIAGVTAAQVGNLAAKMQSLTTYSDEEVRSAENLLLTFTKIGSDIFPETTQAVLDMSTALGQDLKSSSLQLGKALNDPVGGITALKRAGVSFEPTQITLIKHLAETNRLSEAQHLILQEVATEFQGSAKAATKTFSGQMKQLGNQVDDFLEVLGELIVAVGKQLIPVLKDAVDFLGDIVPVLEKGADAMKAFTDAIPDPVKVSFGKALKENFLPGVSIFKALTGGAEETDTAMKNLSESDALHMFEEGKTLAEDFADKIGFLGIHTKTTGEAFAGASRKVHRFAGMTKEALDTFKTDVKKSFSDAVTSMSGFTAKWAFTARSFRHQIDQMRAKARTMRDDLHEFAGLKAIPEKFQAWLLQQGPDAVHAFVRNSAAGRTAIVQDWRTIEGNVKSNESAIDKVTRKLGNVKTAVGDLNGTRANIEINVQYSATGNAGPGPFDRAVIDAVSSQLIHGGQT
jgi:hypothetical protein